jgi:hypothetical protein
MEKWWIAVDGKAEGPYGAAYLVAALKSGQILMSTLACLVGADQWRPIHDWNEFANVAVDPPTIPPLPPDLSAPEQKHPLINARLPTMANWICVYGIVVVPMLWAFNNLSCLMTYANRAPDDQFTVVVDMVSRIVSIPVSVALFIGALRLRDLRLSGCTIIKGTIWVEIGITVLFIAIFILALFGGAYADESAPTQPMTAFDVFGALVGLAAFGFEIAALVWLHRHGKVLPYVAR